MAVRAMRDYAITTLLVLMFVLFSVASWRTEAQQHTQDTIAARQVTAVKDIAANTAKLAAVIDAQCVDRQKAYKAINTVLDTLIENVRVTKSLPDQEKAQRYVSYERAKLPVLACMPTP